ncbi:MAG: efflux RND transporter periplasmic adaptor subunit [Nitrospirae bacterium]|nr:efflux RND transporter periplasmic adaptor subunit [Nitrospirota bacterium]
MSKKGIAAYGKKGAIGLISVALVLGGFLQACSKGKSAQVPRKPAVPVTVEPVTEKAVPVQLTAIGNVEAIATIQVRSQAGGILQKVHFKEGQDVAKGALLFTIDPRPYEAQVKQAEANLARDRAQMENAFEEARRYEELVKKGYVAREQYERFRTNAIAYEATVNADRAMLENARLQLKYCYIYAPVSGRTGSLLADEGNLIKANADSAMVVINQIQPIYVTFSVPEQKLSHIKKQMAEGRLKVGAFLSREDRTPAEGLLTFVDNAVDLATGTIRLKGTFPNTDRRLWPGQFVNTVLTLRTISNATVVPSQAVQTGQQGQFVFTVKPDSTVELRPVITGLSHEGFTLIEKGLQPGEKVVTDGQMRLVPGAKIEIKEAKKEDKKT